MEKSGHVVLLGVLATLLIAASTPLISNDTPTSTGPVLAQPAVQAQLVAGELRSKADDTTNCPYVVNPGQANSDALPAGNLCQCGDIDDDGVVEADDLDIARKKLMNVPVGVPHDMTRCNVVGPSDGGLADCAIDDIFMLDRFLQVPSTELGDVCDAYGAP